MGATKSVERSGTEKSYAVVTGDHHNDRDTSKMAGPFVRVG